MAAEREVILKLNVRPDVSAGQAALARIGDNARTADADVGRLAKTMGSLKMPAGPRFEIPGRKWGQSEGMPDLGVPQAPGGVKAPAEPDQGGGLLKRLLEGLGEKIGGIFATKAPPKIDLSGMQTTIEKGLKAPAAKPLPFPGMGGAGGDGASTPFPGFGKVASADQEAGKSGGVLGGLGAAIGPLGIAAAAAAGGLHLVGTASPATAARLERSFADLGAVIGDRLAPVAEFLGEIFRAVGDVLENILPSSSDINNLMDEFRPVLNEVKEALIDVGPLIKDALVFGLKAVGVALKLLLTPIKWVAEGLRKLADFLGIAPAPEQRKSSVGKANQQVTTYGDIEQISTRAIETALASGRGGRTVAEQQLDVLNEIQANTYKSAWGKAYNEVEKASESGLGLSLGEKFAFELAQGIKDTFTRPQYAPDAQAKSMSEIFKMTFDLIQGKARADHVQDMIDEG